MEFKVGQKWECRKAGNIVKILVVPTYHNAGTFEILQTTEAYWAVGDTRRFSYDGRYTSHSQSDFDLVKKLSHDMFWMNDTVYTNSNKKLTVVGYDGTKILTKTSDGYYEAYEEHQLTKEKPIKYCKHSGYKAVVYSTEPRQVILYNVSSDLRRQLLDLDGLTVDIDIRETE